MALKDFFTLNEMKDGMSTPDRVEELIRLMSIHKDMDVKNVGEASRQRFTAAKTIACTNNRECLDRFVQLGGLSFIDTWLKDIHNGANSCDIPDGFMEDYLIALLQALEKLPVDGEKLTSYGVGTAVKSLTVHSSSEIKERAHTLLDRWKLQMNTSKVDVDGMEEMSVNGCTDVNIKPDESNSMGSSHLDLNNQRKNSVFEYNSDTPGSMLSENVTDVPNAEIGNEVGTLNTVNCEMFKDENSVTHSTDFCIVKENVSDTRSTRADADTGLTNTLNEGHSELKTVEKQSHKQVVEVLADVGSGENGITPALVERSRDDDQSPGACFPESEGGSLRSGDAEAEDPATKATQKDIVVFASEGMFIPEPATTAAQDKMLGGPTEQVFKSLAVLSGKELSSGSITAKDDNDFEGLKPSHSNPVIQEAETETREGAGFDLNEEVIPEDSDNLAVQNQGLNCDIDDHQIINKTSMAMSVISASRPVAVSESPVCLLQFEGSLELKGSAATSAFRPASPHIPQGSDNVTSSTDPSTSLKERDVHDFDLNIVDAENSENIPGSIIAVSSSHPSEESCVEIGPSKSKRAELDLNSLGDAPPAFWSMNGMPFSQQNAYRSPSPASSSSSVHPSMWDLDLNKKFSAPKLVHDPPPCLRNSTINFFEGHEVRKSSVPEISIMGARVDACNADPYVRSPPYPNANHTGFQNFIPPTMNPSPPLPSFMYRPGFPVNMFDPRGSLILPHMNSPAQPPYLMNMMGAPPPQVPISIAPPSYSTFEPNMLYMPDAANRNEPPYTRQYLRTTQGGFLERHSTPVSQPPSFLTKRKEPHSGFDPYQHGLINNHHESPGSKS